MIVLKSYIQIVSKYNSLKGEGEKGGTILR